MCGLAALFDRAGQIEAGWLRGMCDAVRHRGPDDEGFFFDDRARTSAHGGTDTPDSCYRHPYPLPLASWDARGGLRAALGHRRLSILDLSPAGHQPMSDADGACWLVFNGEIFNFIELREELARLGHRFVSGSDTEVILASWRQWGPDCLDRFNGMFAFVLYDRSSDTIFAARDRFAVKPLYVWRAPSGLVAFASEIKQFTGLPGWQPRLNPLRAYDFLNWGLSDHSQETLFADVRQLGGGECLLWRLGEEEMPAPRRWYRLRAEPNGLAFEPACRGFAALFEDAVRLRLRADVPVGTGLSGGLDSSSIVCTMARLLRAAGGTEEQQVFSACAEDLRFDERRFIDEVVRATGVRGHRCFPALDRLFEDLPVLTWHQDEPFGSTSIFAEWSVFDLVRGAGVKVTLDGHGADELLCGYHTFFGAMLVESLARGAFGRVAAELAALRRNHGYSPAAMAKLVGDALLPAWLRNHLRRFGGKTTIDADWIAPWVVGERPQDPFFALGGRGCEVDAFSRSQLLATSLPQQLHWVDRTSMAHSVEGRTPFLDYRLVEFVLGCAPEHRIGGGTTKRLLREGLADTLPPAIRGRQDKMGFVTPEADWVQRADPAGFVGRIETAIEQARGVLTPSALIKAREIIEGRRPYNAVVWRMISFGAWVSRFSVRT